MEKNYLRIALIAVSIAVIFTAFWLVKYYLEDSVMGVKYTELELNRSELYLREGYSYPLKLEPNNFSHIINDDEFQEALGSKPRWKSSDEEVATVSKKGLVTAVASGTATITVKMRGVNCSCKVNSLPKGEDMEIPIRYCNDVFTQELYEQIESIQVVIPLRVEEVTSKYGISTLYSMLAELEKMEKIAGSEDLVRYGPIGMCLNLKEGKKLMWAYSMAVKLALTLPGIPVSMGHNPGMEKGTIIRMK